MTLITAEDLKAFAEIEPDKAAAMVTDALAMAILAAPCLADESELSEGERAAAKAVLRSAILRWNEAGTGARTSAQRGTGPFQVTEAYDNTQPRRAMFQAQEVDQLRSICSTVAERQAFSVDTAPGSGIGWHADECALRFGAAYCSCGADIAGVPLRTVP